MCSVWSYTLVPQPRYNAEPTDDIILTNKRWEDPDKLKREPVVVCVPYSLTFKANVVPVNCR